MSEWEDMCEMMGIPNDEDALDTLISRIESGNRRAARRSPAARSEMDRPLALPQRVCDVLEEVGAPEVVHVQEHQYQYQFRLADGSLIKLFYNAARMASCFSCVSPNPEVTSMVRVALQEKLQAPGPAEFSLWQKGAERLLRQDLADAGWNGVWLDHKPYSTRLVVRRTTFRNDESSPRLAGRHAVLDIRHSQSAASQIVKESGDPGLIELVRSHLQRYVRIEESS